MLTLNLPPYPAKVKADAQGQKYIYDELRLRWVRLTPEEWVRQHFTNFLIQHKHYPKSLIAHEVNMKIGNTNRRCDILLYNRMGLTPLLVVECKAPNVEITQTTFQQVCAYNTVLRAKYTIVTNGMVHYACKIDLDKHTANYLQGIPDYEEIADE